MLSISNEALAVKHALIAAGLETPIVENQTTALEKRQAIQQHIQAIMEILNLDLNDDSLAETPQRVAKMYVDEIFSGLDYHHFPKITVLENKMSVDEMVAVKNITLSSVCEHHFVVFDGKATVAYIPNKHVIGLSKINRVVQFFARRPQIQERLTQQILVALQTLLDTQNVAVSIDAIHYCVRARGVRDVNSSTVTTSLGGIFKRNLSTRQEFLQAVCYLERS